MKIGDKIRFRPHLDFGHSGYHDKDEFTTKIQPTVGTIVYIHPKRRFLIVEYTLNGVKLRDTRYIRRK